MKDVQKETNKGNNQTQDNVRKYFTAEQMRVRGYEPVRSDDNGIPLVWQNDDGEIAFRGMSFDGEPLYRLPHALEETR